MEAYIRHFGDRKQISILDWFNMKYYINIKKEYLNYYNSFIKTDLKLYNKISESYSFKNFFIDFIAGGISGALMTISYYPLDTIKVRMQSCPHEKFISGFVNCYKYEGFLGYFKGMSLPLYTISLINSASLIGNEFSKKLFKVSEDRNLTILQSYLCGYMAGIFTTSIATPVELVKCRLQIQKDNHTNSYYKGISDIVKKEYKYHGVKGLYLGNVSTYFRETFGYAGQFGSYQYLKLKISDYKKIDYDSLSSLDIIFAGSCAGMFGWFVSYPFDIVKTIIQTETKIEIDNNNKHLYDNIITIKNEIKQKENKLFYKYRSIMYDGGMINCLRLVYRNNGIKGLYTGFAPCAISGFYSYGIMFVVYEYIKSLMENKL